MIRIGPAQNQFLLEVAVPVREPFFDSLKVWRLLREQ
jgi:hypothetical protein